MFNLDPGKMIVIAVVAIILLGPDRLPQVARQVGGAWRSFNEFRHRMESEVRGSLPDLPPTSEIARLARSPSALLHHLSTLSPEETAPAESPDGAPEPPEPNAESTVVANAPNGDAPAAPAADSSAQGTRAPTPIPASTQTPVSQPGAHPTAHEQSATRAPDVIVPGDPTLN
jgi:sec-independent protein translocase protein TatB